jgi:hypothetical protein
MRSKRKASTSAGASSAKRQASTRVNRTSSRDTTENSAPRCPSNHQEPLVWILDNLQQILNDYKSESSQRLAQLESTVQDVVNKVADPISPTSTEPSSPESSASLQRDASARNLIRRRPVNSMLFLDASHG